VRPGQLPLVLPQSFFCAAEADVCGLDVEEGNDSESHVNVSETSAIGEYTTWMPQSSVPILPWGVVTAKLAAAILRRGSEVGSGRRVSEDRGRGRCDDQRLQARQLEYTP
jgi:hypothetical protein